MPRLYGHSKAVKSAIIITTEGHGSKAGAGAGAGRMTAPMACEAASTSAPSPWRTQVGDLVIPVDESTASPGQFVSPRQGRGSDWTYGVGHRSWRWDGIPTSVVTHTATVTYTHPRPTADVSKPSSPNPTMSSTRTGGIEVDGLTAAGIGIGTGIGLLGIGIVVVYFCTRRSRRPKRQKPLEKPSDGDETTDNFTWPSYPYSTSNNESPVELPAIRQPEEMCAETKPQEKDASNCSVIAGLYRGSPVIRGATIPNVDMPKRVMVGGHNC
ncbi:hypothetical protein O1611_g6291 [Lasiodiplodia mahajangana]|uniref:Uncharacterized protein n=1 Tax=Lasiodiplodia mahajangana TaxID=1108764 RepID=A0ACC2JIU6_9PEZI|nr:hypothetical protein O1611_g6291 [Lasiodiplodia mahajangana]